VRGLRRGAQCHEVDVDDVESHRSRSARWSNRFHSAKMILYDRETFPFSDEKKGHGRLFWKGFEYVARHMACWRWGGLEVNSALDKLAQGEKT
jgi:hypothetical protein